MTEVNGNLAKIRFLRSAQCAHCGACLTAGESEMEVELLNPAGAKVGDRVSVSLEPKRVVQASLLGYALPLVLLLLGVWGGSQISEVYALLFGVVACGIGYLVLRFVEKAGKKETFRPSIVAVLNRQTDTPEKD